MKLTFEGKIGYRHLDGTVETVVTLFASSFPGEIQTIVPVLYCVFASGHVRALTFDTGTYLPHMHGDSDATMFYLACNRAVYKYRRDPRLPADPEFPGLTLVTAGDPRVPTMGQSNRYFWMAPGLTMMRKTLQCGDADFKPMAGMPMRLIDHDLSKIQFGRADFSKAVLTGSNLAGADISKCSFEIAALRGLAMQGAKLAGGAFSKFDFSNTILDNADLSGANLQGATLVKTRMEGATLNDAILADATLTEAVLNKAKGTGADFKRAKLTDCQAVEVQFKNGLFHGATLKNVSFSGAQLQGAKFSQVKDLGAPTFDKVDFKDAELESADFTGANLTVGKVLAHRPKFGSSVDNRTRFTSATVDVGFLGNDWSYLDVGDGEIVLNASFDGYELKATNCILSDKNKFAKVTFEKADFTSARLVRCNFAGCNLSDAEFTSATLNGADFTGAALDGAKFASADLTGAIFNGADLWEAKFVNSLLVQTDFTQAFLAQADFRAIRDRRMSGVNFGLACLVAAQFNNTSAVRFGNVAPSFSNACLLGADFTGASLLDAVLTNSTLSGAAGSIVAKRPGQSERTVLKYEATKLPVEITGPSTRCPDGNAGPCSMERLRTPKPQEWP